MAEQEQDKSQEATPFKRQEARKKGTVIRSHDIFALTSVGMFLLITLFWGKQIVEQCLMLFAGIFNSIGRLSFNFDSASRWGSEILSCVFNLMLPFWLLIVVAAIVVGGIQVGLVFSTQPLKPDWTKINPLQGFKRLFSLRSLFEAAKSLVKFVIYSAVVFYVVRTLIFNWLLLTNGSLQAISAAFITAMISALKWLFFTMIFVGGADWLFVKYTVNKKLRMSKREVKEEYKRREGDPRIKAKLKEIRNQFLQKVRSVSNVKQADVLVVNPQHIAVAIKYKKDQMAVPMLIAKGAGELALKMKQLAIKYQIPVLENKSLARALYKHVDVDSYIPDQHYVEVAKTLVWAFRIKRGEQ